MKKLIPAALLIISGTAFAQMPSPDEIMKENDKNNDGVITKEEAAASPLGGFFDMIDANHDGKITKEELQNMGGG